MISQFIKSSIYNFLGIIGLLFVSESQMSAQDFIYSQYFSSQTYLNPAMTGFFDGSYRVGANFRTQPISDGSSSVTAGGSADLGLFKQRMGGDYVGIGVLGYNETSGLITNTIGRLNLAYHKQLGQANPQFLTAGLYIGADNQSLNRNMIPAGGVNEIQRFTTSNFDLGLGLNYFNEYSENFSFFIGGSAFHLAPVKNSFFYTDATKDIRYNVYSSWKFAGSKIFNIIPTFLFASQGSHRQINVGTLAQIKFGNFVDDQSTISFGPNIRFGNRSIESFIGLTRLEYKGFSLGLSYDYYLNDLRYVSGAGGAFELSIGYIGLFNSEYQSRSNCPNSKKF